jgi:hypothetical protein
MTPQEPPFEDPSLQRALREIAGNQLASAAMRARVAQRMAATEVDAPPVKIAPKPASSIRRMLAMAAVIVIGVSVGLGGYDWYLNTYGSRTTQANSGTAAPTLWAAMATLHDAGVNGDNEQTPVTIALDKPDAIAAEASTMYDRHVPTPVFPGTAWKLDASSYGTVGGFPGVRFHLTDGSRAITVVSLPKSAWAYPTSDAYTTCVDSHQIAGYLKDGGLHCVIGDRNMPLAEVQALTDQLRAQ